MSRLIAAAYEPGTPIGGTDPAPVALRTTRVEASTSAAALRVDECIPPAYYRRVRGRTS